MKAHLLMIVNILSMAIRETNPGQREAYLNDAFEYIMNVED